MRKVELRMNEQYKYQIIKKLVETNGNKKRAAIKLKRSIRQIDRMIAGYKEFWNLGRVSFPFFLFCTKKQLAFLANCDVVAEVRLELSPFGLWVAKNSFYDKC